ncbi:MAG: AAA domain-containing protein [Bacteroidetes bacterium]|nr:AAA domain-containing protein [Bacteroidota bacterium]MCL6103336.1 AAA domain-containing protein [Bacteroidota bacterium]
MELTEKLLTELQKRLKIGNRRGVHLNAIPSNSRYKFDLNRLAHIDKNLPDNFIQALLTEQPLKFRISWKDNVPDLYTLLEEDQTQLVRITKSFENLINQTEAIESEKGINTFGFGFPILARRDRTDNKLIVAPILIWSLRIKRTKEFNTWEILRNEEDPIYLNEVLINHLQSDSDIVIEQVPSEMLDDGIIDKRELIEICTNLIRAINTSVPDDLEEILKKKLEKVSSIGDKSHFEKLPLNSSNSTIDFCGLFSIFEVQKQNIINDYDHLKGLESLSLNLSDMEGHSFQSISSVETDPSQQSILHSLESKRNILIQGPPGTGKSQTLSAILINALENHRRTIVVCEKRTALEVLHNALVEKGLNYHCVLLRDIIKDRKLVVDSVRNRVDNSSYKKYRYTYSKESLDNLIKKAKSLIESINGKHKKLDERLLGQKSWTDIVGNLLSELNGISEVHALNIDKSQFKYTLQELNELIAIVEKGNILYSEYDSIKSKGFLNPANLQGENPYKLENQIIEKFKEYESDCCQIKELRENSKWWQKIWYPELHREIKTLKEKIKVDNWSRRKIDSRKTQSFLLEVNELIYGSKEYFKINDTFFTEFNWFQYYNTLSGKAKNVVDELKGKPNWRNTFLIHYLNSMLVNFANVELPTSDNELIELNGALSGMEKEQLKFIREFWFSKQIDKTREFEQRNSNLSVENLYNKRSSSKYKRLSLRQIVQYDPVLFTTFFPIILTSPDVCCNLFKGMNGFFDIVMFDEASQLRLEDNLPAILKGKQVIIAGDEHQMPPSNYFSKVFDGTFEDEDDIDEEDEIIVDKDNLLLSCESLLDFGSELNFEKNHLDFHYRSRHPYLIDFSNYAFYNQRLKPLPNDFEYTPIKYIQVNGTFSDYINDAEAEMVLSILEKNINRLPNGEFPTIGIATFNIAQRNHIKSKIIERQKFTKYEEFNAKIQELENNGMFIKNLENIQGDERDVIILSTTYGPGKDGKFAQRFGPINHSKGYKLLNVIISRSKYKIYVCSSVPEQLFMNFKEFLVTEGSNNKRAVFYAYLAYSKAISEGNNDARLAILDTLSENSSKSTSFNLDSFGELESPFEEEVYQRLVDELGETNLIPQLKVSEFRIDIVYDPKIVGIPKIAIECDGAKYHSSREAYLYDRYRQKILESHGFVFHRIWSTNWWRNPQKETKLLIEFIKNIESKNDYVLKDHSNTSNAFTDEIELVESYVAQATYLDVEEEVSTIRSLEKNQVQQAILFTNEIRLHSKVKVKYMNSGKDIIVHVVESTNKYELSNGVQKINIKSPLAISILGHSVGDIVKVGNLDNFVEIIEVIN